MSRLRILAFVPSLGGGGAEKHVERIANAVDRKVASIDVAVVRRGGSYERFLAPDVRVVGLGNGRIRSSTLGMAASVPALRRAMTSQRWDAVIAFLERPTLAALAAHASIGGPNRPALLLSVQADPVSIIAEDPLGPAFESAIRRIYRRADGVIAISEGVGATLSDFDRALEPIVIPNACLDPGHRAAKKISSEPNTIVACGRLVPQKGFDVLLDAFARVFRSVPDARLRILGTGPDESSLRAQIGRLGLGHAIDLPGFVDDPRAHFAKASVFCLSSRFEGLGMVVVEAMSVGTPVVSTDCPHGPREILEGGRNGMLVRPEDPAALAEALTTMLREGSVRERFSERGLARALDYSSEAVASRYVDAVRVAVERASSRRSKS